jgi:predicted MFS family arabinose efflux permease
LGLLCLEAAAVMMNVAAQAAIVPAIAETFGLSNFVCGRIIPVYMIPYALAALFYGYLADIWSKKRIKLTCLFLFILFTCASGLAPSLRILFIFRFLVGLSAAACVPISLTLIGELSAPEKRGRSVGILFGSVYCSSLVGVFLTGFIPWRWIFFIPALVGLAALLLIYFNLPLTKRASLAKKVTYGKVLFSHRGRRVYSYVFLTAFIATGIYSWLGVFFWQEKGFTQFQISTLLTMAGIGSIFGPLLGGVLADKWGRRPLVVLGLFLAGFSVFFFTRQMAFVVIGSLLLFYGLGRTMIHNSLVTMVTDFPDSFRPRAASLNSFVRLLSGGLGTALTGIFVVRNFQLSFSVYALLLLILAVIAYPILTRGKNDE